VRVEGRVYITLPGSMNSGDSAGSASEFGHHIFDVYICMYIYIYISYMFVVSDPVHLLQRLEQIPCPILHTAIYAKYEMPISGFCRQVEYRPCLRQI